MNPSPPARLEAASSGLSFGQPTNFNRITSKIRCDNYIYIYIFNILLLALKNVSIPLSPSGTNKLRTEKPWNHWSSERPLTVSISCTSLTRRSKVLISTQKMPFFLFSFFWVETTFGFAACPDSFRHFPFVSVLNFTIFYFHIFHGSVSIISCSDLSL